VVECSEFLDLWEGLDLGKDSDLVRYFKSVLDRRKENEDRKQKVASSARLQCYAL
jgi:hypothetical protein